MKRLHPVILSLLSGVLLWISWPASPFTAFIFFAFVPLLLVAEKVSQRSRFVGHSFLALLVWNIGSTWWIWNSTDVGSIAAMVANSMLMALPWWGYHVFRQKFGRRVGYYSLVAFWMLFEYIHLNWQLSWPWLSLGNVFATQTDWVQWYEYTGVGGGTLWVLVLNVLIYDWMFGGEGKVKSKNSKFKKATLIACFLVIPISISYLFTFGIDFAKGGRPQVIIVQPNIDPYEKFEAGTVAQQVQTHLALTQSAIDANTKLVIWPETALSANAEITVLDKVPEYQPVFEFIRQHPNVTLLTGVETYRWYGNEQPASPYARKTPDGHYYDSYNAAISLRAGEPIPLYVKSKLVPGVETLPAFLNFLGPVFEKFGGTTGGYAMDTSAVVFRHAGSGIVTAPIICYESIYGEYVASYVQKGANLLTIMTNDGWWGNTPGHKQHLHYARLRAIETRRWVARSANTGISAVIDHYGNILDRRGWDSAAVIKKDMRLNTDLTFYVRYGDYLYRGFAVVAGILLLWHLVTAVRKRTTKAM